VLSDVALLREAGVQTLANLAAGAQEVSFPAGAEVLARGAERDRLFIVADGLVEAAREGPAVSGRFGPGALVAGGAALG
jgi:CRP-like cAMP-binding protein